MWTWLIDRLFTRVLRPQREITHDLQIVARKEQELSERLHPIASRTHVLEFEAYGNVRARSADEEPPDATSDEQ